MSSSGLTSNVCHTYGSAPRGSTLGVRGSAARGPQRGGWRLLPETTQALAPPGRAKPGNQGGPHGQAGSQVKSHLHFPFLVHRVTFRDHPRTPHHKEIIHSHGPLKVYRSLPAVGAAGLCSHPSRAPIQDHEPEKPRNYNPHNDPRLSRSRREGWRPRASDRGRSMAVTLGAPLPALPLAPVSLGLITPVPQAGRLLVMRSRSGGVGVEPRPPLRRCGAR